MLSYMYISVAFLLLLLCLTLDKKIQCKLNHDMGGGQRWGSGESTCLPLMRPGFDSHHWLCVGSVCSQFLVFLCKLRFPHLHKIGISKFLFECHGLLIIKVNLFINVEILNLALSTCTREATIMAILNQGKGRSEKNCWCETSLFYLQRF